jgi:hypothetical protein
MIMRNADRLAPAAIAAAFVIVAGGCQFAPTKKVWPMTWFAKDEEPAVPDRMMIVWTDTILHQPQKPGVRGFGGRVFFYSGNETTPVKVDGSLTIYAYDNDNLDSDSTRPERKFVFTGEQFEKHMSYTDLGPSYSIWLPWDEVGGEGRQLSLVSRFDGTSGGVVISKPAIKLLPGLAKKDRRADTSLAKSDSGGVRRAGAEIGDSGTAGASGPSVARVGYDEDGDHTSQAATRLQRPKPPRVSSMMIDLPPNFQRHLIDDPTRKSTSINQSTPQASEPKSKTDSSDNGDSKTKVSATSDSSAESTPESDSASATTTNTGARKNATTNPRFSRSMKAFRNYANGGESFQEPPAQTLNRPAGWLEPVARPQR